MDTVTKRSTAERAKAHLFAAQQTYYEQPLTLVNGEGTRVRDDQGKEYLDAFAGIATNTLGYGDTEVAQAVAEQGEGIALHVSTLYLTEQQLDFAEKIADISPAGMTKSFVSNSGSEANETAALVARTFKNSPDFLALEHAYHGRTVYTVALAGLSNWRNFGPQMPHVAFVPNPYCYRCPLNLTYPSCEVACAKAAKRVIETATNWGTCVCDDCGNDFGRRRHHHATQGILPGTQRHARAVWYAPDCRRSASRLGAHG